MTSRVLSSRRNFNTQEDIDSQNGNCIRNVIICLCAIHFSLDYSSSPKIFVSVYESKNRDSNKQRVKRSNCKGKRRRIKIDWRSKTKEFDAFRRQSVYTVWRKCDLKAHKLYTYVFRTSHVPPSVFTTRRRLSVVFVVNSGADARAPVVRLVNFATTCPLLTANN